jgi:hypothetical protein
LVVVEPAGYKVDQHRVEQTEKVLQDTQAEKAVTLDQEDTQDQAEVAEEPLRSLQMEPRLPQQEAVEVVPEQVWHQTVQQVTTDTQQQENHQAHLVRTVRITPATVVVEVLVAEVLMVERQVMQGQETTAVRVVSQDQTQRQVAQRATAQESRQEEQIMLFTVQELPLVDNQVIQVLMVRQ